MKKLTQFLAIILIAIIIGGYFFSLGSPNKSSEDLIPITSTSDANFYYIGGSIKKSNGHIYISILTDLNEPIGGGNVYSTKINVQFDCQKNKYRELNFIAFEGSMGKGKVYADKAELYPKWEQTTGLFKDLSEVACSVY